MNDANDSHKVVNGEFEQWFSDAEIEILLARMRIVDVITIPKTDVLRIIRRMRAARLEKERR